jgi:arabinogalactan oligomer/maltooligosaccharide transport system permease protein
MFESLMQSIHPLLLLQKFASMGLVGSLFFIILGAITALGALRSLRSSIWLATVGIGSMAAMYVLLGAEFKSPWLIAALLGTGLILWISLTPLFSLTSKFFTPILASLSLLLLVCDTSRIIDQICVYIGLQENSWFTQARPFMIAALLLMLLFWAAVRYAVLIRRIQHIAWAYFGTIIIIAGIASLYGKPAPWPQEALHLYLTIFVAAVWLGDYHARLMRDEPDLLVRYRPWAGVYATHLFLICFTIVTLYPVLWVFKMAATPQQGFSVELNPIPTPLVQYVQAWRQGDHAAASCYGRALSQNFRGVLGVGSACYDEICQAYRSTHDVTLLQKQQRICSSFAAAWQTPQEQRRTSVQQWREDMVLQAVPTQREQFTKLLERVEQQQNERDRRGFLFWRQLFNSSIIALITTIFGLILACTAAYAFSRFRFPGRQTGLMSFLVSQMFPGTLMMIPLYVLMSRLGLLDSWMGLALVYSTTSIPFCVWMLKGYFDTIPQEIEEAALIDGASRLLIFWKIMLPLARPAIAVTALFSFMTAWNEFILAATFMNDEKLYTLPVMLQQFVGQHKTEWGYFAAGAILVSLPVVALFFALQKNLVGGLTAGSVKG